MPSSTSFDVAPYFEPFNLTPKRMGQISRLLKSRVTWWGIDDLGLTERIVLLVAPGNLSQLSPEAVDLLKRCKNRTWAFQIKSDDHYSISRQTYGALFAKLLNLGLIVEADARSKLKGSQTVDQLRGLLGRLGVSAKGNKDALVDRAIEHLSSSELEALTSRVVLYMTTSAGDDAIRAIQDLTEKVRPAISNALSANREHLGSIKPPMPEHVPPDMAEVYSEEEWQEIRALPDLSAGDDSLVSISRPRYDHPSGPGNPRPGWNQVTDTQMTTDQRRLIIIDGLVAVSNQATPGFVIFSDRAKPEHYAQFILGYCEVAAQVWEKGQKMTLDQEHAVLALGFSPPDKRTLNYWMDCGDKALLEMASIVESALRTLGSALDFGLQVEFDEGT